MRRNTVFLAMAVSVIISGCSGGNTGRAEYSETGVTAESMTAAQTEAKTINTVTAVSQHTGEAASGTLIAYFTWADNTVVEIRKPPYRAPWHIMIP